MFKFRSGTHGLNEELGRHTGRVSCRIRVGLVSWVSFIYTVVMCMVVIVAPPIVVGAWSMAFLLRQHVEYYYYCIYNTLPVLQLQEQLHVHMHAHYSAASLQFANIRTM